MLTLTEILLIILIHWIADFVLQTEKQAKCKSKNLHDLLSHTIYYSIITSLFYILLFPCIYSFTELEPGYLNIIYFTLITFITHTITDYFTSRINNKFIPEREYVHSYKIIDKFSFFRYKNENWHNFFVSIGFDQVLHYTQLFMCYYLLKN